MAKMCIKLLAERTVSKLFSFQEVLDCFKYELYNFAFQTERPQEKKEKSKGNFTHLLPVNRIKFLYLPEKAPMCCVIPPNSVLTTDVFRRESKRVVFPWSTCPMIVTTGGRFTRTEGSGGGLLSGYKHINII